MGISAKAWEPKERSRMQKLENKLIKMQMENAKKREKKGDKKND